MSSRTGELAALQIAMIQWLRNSQTTFAKQLTARELRSPHFVLTDDEFGLHMARAALSVFDAAQSTAVAMWVDKTKPAAQTNL